MNKRLFTILALIVCCLGSSQAQAMQRNQAGRGAQSNQVTLSKEEIEKLVAQKVQEAMQQQQMEADRRRAAELSATTLADMQRSHGERDRS